MSADVIVADLGVVVWEGNYRLVIELCHLSRLPLAEMDWTKKETVQMRRAVKYDCLSNSLVVLSVLSNRPNVRIRNYRA